MRRVHIDWLLQKLAIHSNDKYCVSLLAQPCMQIATLLEKDVTSALAPRYKPHDHQITAAYATLEDLCKDQHALNAYLLRNVLTGIDASRPHSSSTLISDKGAVAGLSLDMGAIVLPSNTCIVVVPQVGPAPFLSSHDVGWSHFPAYTARPPHAGT